MCQFGENLRNSFKMLILTLFDSFLPNGNFEISEFAFRNLDSQGAGR